MSGTRVTLIVTASSRVPGETRKLDQLFSSGPLITLIHSAQPSLFTHTLSLDTRTLAATMHIITHLR